MIAANACSFLHTVHSIKVTEGPSNAFIQDQDIHWWVAKEWANNSEVTLWLAIQTVVLCVDNLG